MRSESGSSRSLTEAELGLLKSLLVRWLGRLPDWTPTVQAIPMNDGGMGSLRLIVQGQSENQSPLTLAAETRFNDSDGVEVVASLFVASDGLPYELDLWKVDFKQLTGIPDLGETT